MRWRDSGKSIQKIDKVGITRGKNDIKMIIVVMRSYRLKSMIRSLKRKTSTKSMMMRK